MTTYIALLRGINVGGHKLIKMTELQRVFTAMGFGRVQTYIQSGNVLFQAEGDADNLCRRIEHEIEATFGFPVPVILRTAAELEQVIGNCPFAADALAPSESLYVFLLVGAPAADGVARLLASDQAVDECRSVGREVYLLCRQGMANTKFTNNFVEKRLGVTATARNWQTMNKLLQLAKAMES